MATSYVSLLKSKFPHDEQAGLYVAPKMPGAKLGKLLMRDTRVSSPNDVVAMHLNEGMFSSSGVYFTATKCYYEGGEFLLEDVRECSIDSTACTVVANSLGNMQQHRFKVKNEQVAQIFRKLFQDMAYRDPVAEAATQAVAQLDNLNRDEIAWLKLRDEIMRTIDQLYTRFNDGKLSLIEYEEKKAELLERL